ncbi:MAG: mitochondrial splicing system protein [Candelina submexicana]|nr:MAG: mitochondrial splicing system protein [Candelina submexicana]
MRNVRFLSRLSVDYQTRFRSLWTTPRPSLRWVKPGSGQTIRPFHISSTLYNKNRTEPLKNTTEKRINRSSATASTIFALSTAPGRAAIAIVRVSGFADTFKIYKALCPGRPLPSPRYATLRTLYDPPSCSSQVPTSGGIIDPNALILYFPAPRTVTGEDVLELHVHGGPAVVKAVLTAIPRCMPKASHQSGPLTPLIRYAEPGEFTRRAFMNDRLDLTQIEALGDTLAATTEQQRRLSVRGTTSGLAKRYESWRQQLLYARGELEALIDFSEDQHLDESPAKLASSVASQVKALRDLTKAHIVNAVRGELLRNGISICLLGSPNVGKSSLLNLIVGREAAIVSHEAGTTRDVVEVGIDLGGYYCRFSDTAGLRTGPIESLSEVELEGMKRAKQRALNADIVILLLEVDPKPENRHCKVNIEQEIETLAVESHEQKDNVMVVVNKADLIEGYVDLDDFEEELNDWDENGPRSPDASKARTCLISCANAGNSMYADTDDAGRIQHMLGHLKKLCQRITSPEIPSIEGQQTDRSVWEESLGATERQRLLLDECGHHLDSFLVPFNIQGEREITVDEDDVDIVVAAESLRAAANCLAKITGKGEGGDVEEVLGVVFEK